MGFRARMGSRRGYGGRSQISWPDSRGWRIKIRTYLVARYPGDFLNLQHAPVRDVRPLRNRLHSYAKRIREAAQSTTGRKNSVECRIAASHALIKSCLNWKSRVT